MSRRACLLALFLAALGSWAVRSPSSELVTAAEPEREISITFDDLPAVSVARGDLASLGVFTDKLLANFTANEVPVIGFVNEGKLAVAGEGIDGQAARTALLRKWLDAGFVLGNHTYSHRSLNDLALEEFEADVVRGKPASVALMGAQGRKLRYFRHPFLQVGLDLNKRQAFEAWLTARGYLVAPVTIDNDDYIFAAVYAANLKAGDVSTAQKTARAYIDYMDLVFDFNEGLSQALFGRPIRHVLLLHANQLNADHSGTLFKRLRERHYVFVPIERALEDPAYQSADSYVGRWGISWMHHWEQAMGRPRTGSPDPPSWVSAAYEKERR